MIGEDLLVSLAASILIATFLERDEIVGAMTVDHFIHEHDRRTA